MENDVHNEVILVARLFLTALFLIFDWRKLTDYTGTVRQMVEHLPARRRCASRCRPDERSLPFAPERARLVRVFGLAWLWPYTCGSRNGRYGIPRLA
jgi:hypothetical protein